MFDSDVCSLITAVIYNEQDALRFLKDRPAVDRLLPLTPNALAVLADVDLMSMNIDPVRIEEKITSKTKCILPVHFAGRSCEMNEIVQIAKKHELYIIEDCPHQGWCE